MIELLVPLQAEASDGSARFVFPLVIGVIVLLNLFWLWALLDVIRRPEVAWAAAGQRKASWALRVGILGWPGAAWYVAGGRRRLLESSHGS